MSKEEITPDPSKQDSVQNSKKSSLSLGQILGFLEEEGYTGGRFVGIDLPGIDKDEHFNLAQRMKDDPDSLCFARVLEDSLKEIGIRIGDVLCIDKTASPKINDLVVSDVGGTVIRRLLYENGLYELRPVNPLLRSIRSEASNTFEIWGVVKQVMRTFEWDGSPDFRMTASEGGEPKGG